MATRLSRFRRTVQRSDRGASGVEYALVVAAVVVGLIVSIDAMEPRIEEKYEQTADDIGNPDVRSFAPPTSAPPSGGGGGGGGGGTSLPVPGEIAFTPSASSEGFGGVATRLNDGNTSGEWGDGGIAHTAGGDSGWYELTMSVPHTITEITLWNRTDGCCASRQQGIVITLDGVPIDPAHYGFGSDGIDLPDDPAGNSLTLDLSAHPDGPFFGSVIRIVNGTEPVNESFQLAEVQIVGVDASLTQDQIDEINAGGTI